MPNSVGKPGLFFAARSRTARPLQLRFGRDRPVGRNPAFLPLIDGVFHATGAVLGLGAHDLEFAHGEAGLAKISRPLCGLLVNFSVLMPRAFRSMRFKLEWFEGKPSPPLSHGPRRSAGSESALNWTRCGPGSRSPCKVEGRSAAESAGTNK